MVSHWHTAPITFLFILWGIFRLLPWVFLSIQKNLPKSEAKYIKIQINSHPGAVYWAALYVLKYYLEMFNMGTVFAEITLKNASDTGKAQEGLFKEEDIRSVTVNSIVDTGSMSLVITEELRQKLGLRINGEKSVRTANGQRVSCGLTEAVEIHWKNRISILSAVVIPGAEFVLLGAIPLEDMDLMVNPVTQELVGIHGDSVECMAYCA